MKTARTKCLWNGLLVWGIAIVSLSAADDFLPSWRDDQERIEWQDAGWIPGWDLLGNDFPVLENQSPLEPLEWIAPVAGDMLEEGGASEIVEERWADAYFGARSHSFLVDPQGLFSVEEREKIERWLAEHAAETAIDIRVFLFDSKQEIPGEWREEEQVERLFGTGRPTVMLTYFHGLPHRSVISLVPSLAQEISIAEQHRTLESCVVHSQSRIDPTEQLEAFLQQLSIRVYWMGHTCGLEAAAESDSQWTVPNQKGRSFPQEEKKARLKIPTWMEPALSEVMVIWPWVASGVVALLVIFFCVVISWCFGRRRFPVPRVEPRLGGPHAAGVGAVITFSSVAHPPAAQRLQLPDLPKRD